MYEFRLRFHCLFFPTGRINYIPTLVQIMAWCRPGELMINIHIYSKMCLCLYIFWHLHKRNVVPAYIPRIPARHNTETVSITQQIDVNVCLGNFRVHDVKTILSSPCAR